MSTTCRNCQRNHKLIFSNFILHNDIRAYFQFKNLSSAISSLPKRPNGNIHSKSTAKSTPAVHKNSTVFTHRPPPSKITRIESARKSDYAALEEKIIQSVFIPVNENPDLERIFRQLVGKEIDSSILLFKEYISKLDEDGSKLPKLTRNDVLMFLKLCMRYRIDKFAVYLWGNMDLVLEGAELIDYENASMENSQLIIFTVLVAIRLQKFEFIYDVYDRIKGIQQPVLGMSEFYDLVLSGIEDSGTHDVEAHLFAVKLFLESTTKISDLQLSSSTFSHLLRSIFVAMKSRWTKKTGEEEDVVDFDKVMSLLVAKISAQSIIPRSGDLPLFFQIFTEVGKVNEALRCLELLRTTNQTRTIEFNHARIIRGLFDEAKPDLAVVYFLSVTKNNFVTSGRKRPLLVSEVSIETVTPNFEMFTEMIDGFCRLEDVNRAIKFYEQMLISNVLPTSATMFKLLQLFAKVGDYERAEIVFNELGQFEQKHCKTHTMLLTACANGILNAKIYDDETAVTAAIQVARRCWHNAFDIELKPDIQMVHSMFMVMLNSDRFDEAGKFYTPFLDNLIKDVEVAGKKKASTDEDTFVDPRTGKPLKNDFKNIKANLHFFNAYINHLLSSKRTAESDEHFNLLLKLNLIPDEYTLTAFLKFHFKSDDVPQVFRTFSQMVPKYKIQLSTAAYSYLLQSCGNHKSVNSTESFQVKEDSPWNTSQVMKQVMKSMTDNQIPPDISTWTSILNAYCRVKEYEKVWKVWRLLRENERKEKIKWDEVMQGAVGKRTKLVSESVARNLFGAKQRRLLPTQKTKFWQADDKAVYVVLKSCFNAATADADNEEVWITRAISLWSDLAKDGYIFGEKCWIFMLLKLKKFDVKQKAINEVVLLAANSYLATLAIQHHTIQENAFKLREHSPEYEIPFSVLVEFVESLQSVEHLKTLLLGVENVLYQQRNLNSVVMKKEIVDVIQNELSTLQSDNSPVNEE